MAAEADEEAQFGPYLVYERLGVGGMATVHRALERGIEGFERIVALKRLLPHLAEDASFIKAFVREAKLASALNHVNIVQIFELGRVGTEYFISMEYIDGRDIRRILRHARKVTGPPPINVTVGLLLQLCEALDYAHNKSDDDGVPMLLVHRDVSPSNVLVTSAGHVKVIDFGIAKAQSSQLRTQTGRVKGKLAYMAPEAVAGKELDARSDLFAVGVIAHELLTARPLFASKNEYQTLLKVQRGDIMPPSTFNQGCHAELDAIVLRALARDPDDRYNGAAELRDDLLALRKQYNLATNMRDIASWLEWAFALEIPTGGFAGNTGDQVSKSLDVKSPVRGRTPRGNTPPSGSRRSSEVDDAVELAWGSEHESQDGPIVLDDVPDVSGKHLLLPMDAAPSRLSAQHDAHRLFDDDDIDDDIPTPVPSHGRAPSRPTPRPGASSPGATPLPGSRSSGSLPAMRDSSPKLPRERRSTDQGHLPARSRTETGTDPDGNSLVDALHAANDAAETMREMPAADTQPSMPALGARTTRTTAPLATPPIATPVPAARTTLPPIATQVPASRTTPPPIATQVPTSRTTPPPIATQVPASRATPPFGPATPPTTPPPSSATNVPASRTTPPPFGPAAARTTPPPIATQIPASRATPPPIATQVPASRTTPPPFGPATPPTTPPPPSATHVPASRTTPPPFGPVAARITPPPIAPGSALRTTSPLIPALPVSRTTPPPFDRPSAPSLATLPSGSSEKLVPTGSSERLVPHGFDDADDRQTPIPSGFEDASDRSTPIPIDFDDDRPTPIPNDPADRAALAAAERRIAAERATPSERMTPERMTPPPPDRASPNPLPVVRFREPTSPPAIEPAPSMLPVGVPLSQQVRTKPGHAPARAVTAAPDDEDIPTLAPDPAAPIQRIRKNAASTGPAIGEAMLRQKAKGPRKSWVILAGIAAAGAVATATTLYITRGDQVKPVTEASQPRVAPRTIGTVKFNLEPADAEIVIGGKLAHAGSPFQIELEAGVHQIQINRSGYKAWLTALELSSSETQTLRVVLEPLGAAVAAADPEGTLILSSTPPGLEAVLDGKVLPVRTPIKMPIKVGPHTIVLRDHGEEVWRQDLVAQANAEHEFSPSMDATKLRERAERTAAPVVHRPAAPETVPTPPPRDLPSVAESATPPAPAPTAPPAGGTSSAMTTAPAKATPPANTATTTPPTAPAKTTPPAPAITKPVTPTPPPPPAPAPAPAITPPAPTAPPAAPRISGPVTIPPSKVTKLSGAVPELSRTKHGEIPPVVAAKLCIDHTGTVTSADLITKLEARSALEMVQTLKAWRYTPYKPTGSPTASAACFAVSFRTK